MFKAKRVILKSLARFSTQFRVKESLRILLAEKGTFSDKSRNSLATKEL